MVLFNLITGFLGSGKTTLLANLLKDLSKTKRIAVIQNEFAPSGTDGRDLKLTSSGFRLVEINNGSVFCVCQLANFTQQLEKIISDYDPEIIFLEASGLADPISIVDILQHHELKDKIRLDKSICLVDAHNFFKGLSSLSRFRHQIMIADKIIINKMDLFTGETDNLMAAIREINPFAEIYTTEYARVNWEELAVAETSEGVLAEKFTGIESAGRPDMKALVLRTHEVMEEFQLRRFLEILQPACPRIKGHMKLKTGQFVSIQSVFEDLKIAEITDYSGLSELIVFGYDISISELRKSFKEILKEKQ